MERPCRFGNRRRKHARERETAPRMEDSTDLAGYETIAVRRFPDRGHGTEDHDAVVVEEPLEMRLNGDAVATVMRTPGHDRDLALGFFLAEGIIDQLSDVASLAVCGRSDGEESAVGGQLRPTEVLQDIRQNVVDLRAPGVAPRHEHRSFPVSSSCGVCGKRSIDEVLALIPTSESGRLEQPGDLTGKRPPIQIPAERLKTLPEILRAKQDLFRVTGGLHGAALFTLQGECLVVREDVGRHNAVDKVIGWAFLEKRLPLSQQILQVSGRVSFEIVQKAYRAGIPMVTAVSGISTLAASLASQAGVTLVAFLRGESFNVYSHPGRIVV